MKIVPVVAELFRADRRTDATKLIDAFHTFAKVPKNGQKKNKFWTSIFVFILYSLRHCHICNDFHFRILTLLPVNVI